MAARCAGPYCTSADKDCRFGFPSKALESEPRRRRRAPEGKSPLCVVPTSAHLMVCPSCPLTMDTAYDLERFVIAQNAAGTYGRAVEELRRGRKTSHWMWFVFPQIAGLGQSTASRTFAISSLDEARAYLQHDVLGARLKECTSIVAQGSQASAEAIFGTVDAQKLRSSMTLFLRAAPDEPVFGQVLRQLFDDQPDDATDRLI